MYQSEMTKKEGRITQNLWTQVMDVLPSAATCTWWMNKREQRETHSELDVKLRNWPKKKKRRVILEQNSMHGKKSEFMQIYSWILKPGWDQATKHAEHAEVIMLYFKMFTCFPLVHVQSKNWERKKNHSSHTQVPKSCAVTGRLVDAIEGWEGSWVEGLIRRGEKEDS